MKFAVKTASWSNGRARSGVLELGSLPHAIIETPALLLTTRKGLPIFIPPDLLPSLPYPDSHLLQFSPIHFYDSFTPKTISDIGGVHAMVGLRQHVLVSVPRDSIISLPEYDRTNKTGASFQTPGGCRLIKPAEYMQMVCSMKPDLWVTLPDEVPAWVSNKRNRTSVDRTLRWLDDCISFNRTGGTIFGSIVGGSSVEERQRCAQEVVRRNVSGYWIGGFGLGESMDERSALLSVVVDNLPEDKPRQISGLGLPEEVLQGVAAGIDLFDSTYIYHLTLGGFALTFPLETSNREVPDYKLRDSGIGDMKISLKSTIYRLMSFGVNLFWPSISWIKAILDNSLRCWYNLCAYHNEYKATPLQPQILPERCITDSRKLQLLYMPESYKGIFESLIQRSRNVGSNSIGNTQYTPLSGVLPFY